jgi:hypothetical protein
LASKALLYQQTPKTPMETIDDKPGFSDPTDEFPLMTKTREQKTKKKKKKKFKPFPINPTTLY